MAVLRDRQPRHRGDQVRLEPGGAPGVRAGVPAVEGRERGVTLLLLVALALALPGTDLPHVLVGGGVGAVVGWLAASDLRTHRVPNRVVLPALAVLSGVLLGWAGAAGDLPRLAGAALGAGGVALALLAVSAATRGGVGLGDVKVGALVGLWTGWLDPRAPVAALVAASVAGGLAVLAGRAAGRLSLSTRVPLVPALATGAIAATWWTRWGF
ncbi:MAG: prepilin peptidase [Actinobacteria bacterium]|nr:prepilin peptidase [Actinomycetota bacterium]